MLTFNNINFFTGTTNELICRIFDNTEFSPANKLIITHINLRNYYYLIKNEKLANWLNKNCVLAFEGIGLKILFWLKGYGINKDLNGTDLFPLFMKRMQKKKLNIFLLGSEMNVISKAAGNTEKQYPGIKICGYQDGYFNRSNEKKIIDNINKCGTDVLIAGMGFPAQEEFIIRNIQYLNAGLIWFVGGLFDFISGTKPRAPLFIRKIRLEWLFRFLLEPRRMFYRNTVCAFGAIKHILTH